jgi:hypothetical protein
MRIEYKNVIFFFNSTDLLHIFSNLKNTSLLELGLKKKLDPN